MRPERSIAADCQDTSRFGLPTGTPCRAKVVMLNANKVELLKRDLLADPQQFELASN